MPNASAPLQLDQVVTALRRDGACAIVHLSTRLEVDVETDIYNQRDPWRIRTLFFADLPEQDLLRRALALGFQLHRLEGRESIYELHRNCLGDTAAATHALTLARLLPGVPPDAWLWITASEYDDRDVPPPTPPPRWPPPP